MTKVQINKVDLAVAGLFRRLAAAFYDCLLVASIWMAIGGIFVYLNNNEAVSSPFFQSTLFLATFAFYTFFWHRNGQTLGMRAWRIKLVSLTGQPISLNQCLLRFMVALLSWGFLGLGWLWMLFDKEKRTWHDRVSETQLVHIPKKKGSQAGS